MTDPSNIEQHLRRVEAEFCSARSNSSFFRPLSQSVQAAAAHSKPSVEAKPVLYQKPRVVLKVVDSDGSRAYSVVSNHGEMGVYGNSASLSSACCTPSAATIQKVIQNDMDAARKMKLKERCKKRKFVRMAGGEVWEDDTLQDWDPEDFRLFCGDLGNEVNDDTLTCAFKAYPSFQKAKVVRDKRTGKTKGFGFVSFSDSQDFIKAMREMNGRYVGNRPIKLRKSNWRDRNIEVVRKKQKEKAALTNDDSSSRL